MLEFEKRRARMEPGPSAFDFRLSLIGVSFPTATSEFRKRGFKHEVTSMFVALVANAQRSPAFPPEHGCVF
jgi:hypothetical protein